jgi:hypothetical protein
MLIGVEVVVEICKLKLAVCPAARVSEEGIGDETGPPAIAGSRLSLRLIVPAKPPMLSTLMMETASTPGFTHRLDGVDVRTKSAAWARSTGPMVSALTMIMIGTARIAHI